MSGPRRQFSLFGTIVLAVLVGACAPGIHMSRDSTSAVLGPLLQRYVAIGTSISTGWRADGITRQTQADAWPSQLARMAGQAMTVPDLEDALCRSPVVAPLAHRRRTDGSPLLGTAGELSCRSGGADLARHIPANLAIPGARTVDALRTVPEFAKGKHASFYHLALPLGMTQVAAMEVQRPTFVSVELGANEVFGAYSGIVDGDSALISPVSWQQQYTEVLERVSAVTTRALLVALVDSLAQIPAFRRGDDLWSQREVLRLVFHVRVDPECRGNRNLIFVPLVVPPALGDGAARRKKGLGPARVSCANREGTEPDYVLTPADEARVNAQLAEMNAFVRHRADSLGFAQVDLDAIYPPERARQRFSVLSMVLSSTPFGPLVSADGLHPSAAGNRAFAMAAAQAIATTYGAGAHRTSDRQR